MKSQELLQEELRKQQDVVPDNGSATQRPGRTLSASDRAPDEGRRVTKEEYFAKWYENPYPDIDVSYEWNNGILEAKPLPNQPQLDLYNWFLILLHCNTVTFRHASLLNLETGFELTMPDPDAPSGKREAVRKPDVGVILNSNPTPWGRIDQRHFEGVCDLVVEAVSDSTMAEVLRDTEEKKEDYALGGVREYFILDPNGEHTRFYRLTQQSRYESIQPDDKGVIRSDILAGFQFRVEDLNRKPPLEELALDPVYCEYVVPGYKTSVQKAANEAQRAEREAQRAQNEAQRAERETQRAETEAKRAETEAKRAETEAKRAERETQRAQNEAAARKQAEERATLSEGRERELETELERLRKRLS